MSERTKLASHLVLTALMACLIYPFVLAWTVGEGWLYQKGFRDFAGSGFFHFFAGLASLAGILAVGPRYNRWSVYDEALDYAEKVQIKRVFKAQSEDKRGVEIQEDGVQMRNDPIEKNKENVVTKKSLKRLRSKAWHKRHEEFVPHSVAFVTFGSLLVILGQAMVTAGFTAAMFEGKAWKEAEKAFLNCLIAGGGGAFISVFKHYLMKLSLFAPRSFREDAFTICNGFLVGMAAVAAGADDYKSTPTFLPFISFLLNSK